MFTIAKAYSHSLTVFLGTVLLAVSAQIQIPIQPVPITFQATLVMVLGLFFEKRAALQALILYLILGGLGMPVFANFTSGYGVLIGSSAGYLLGFLVAVWVMTSFKTEPLISVLLGTFCIYACGASWLLLLGMSVEQTIIFGVMPFIIPGLIKSFILVGIVKFLRS